MTRSLLVYLPGYPYTAETLMPQHLLAAMASALTEAGHETYVLDYGTVDDLAALTAGRLANALLGASAADLWEENAGVCSRWTARRRRRALTGMVRQAETRQCASAAMEIGTHKSLDFVVLYIPRREDAAPALRLAKALRVQTPSVRILLAGEHVNGYASFLLAASEFVDGCIVGDGEPTVVALADGMRLAHSWTNLPNLVIREGADIRAARREEIPRLDALPWPCYRREYYPAIYGGGKFRVFTVRESRGFDHVPHTAQRSPFEPHQVRVRSPRRVCDELRALSRDCGARAFHFLGSATPAAAFDAICREILGECLHICYSRAGHVRHTDPAAVSTLRDSGCRAIQFQVDTGSQRLLEDYYGHDFGVTTIETVFRACRDAELFIEARFTYPCPEDDYHARAETLRLVRRSLPHAVRLALPEAAPGSDWWDFAREFGFHIDPRAVAHWAAAAADPFAAPYAHASHGMKGRRAAEIRREYTGLLSDLQFEGFPTAVTAQEALLARLCGQHNAEASYSERLRELLFVGDAEALAAQVRAFNDRAVVPANTIPFVPYTSVRAAVGN